MNTRRLTLVLLISIMAILLFAGIANATVLYADSFNRTNSNTVGGSWVQYPYASGANASINSSKLLLQRAASVSNFALIYLDIGSNFTSNSTIEFDWYMPSGSYAVCSFGRDKQPIMSTSWQTDFTDISSHITSSNVASFAETVQQEYYASPVATYTKVHVKWYNFTNFAAGKFVSEINGTTYQTTGDTTDNSTYIFKCNTNNGATQTYFWVDEFCHYNGTSTYADCWTTTTPDTTPPTITLNYPANGSTINTNTINYTWTTLDENLTTLCNLTVDNLRLANNTPTTNNTLTNTSLAGITDGTHYWNVTCTDGTNTNTSITQTFTTDTTQPSITLNYPSAGTTLDLISINFTWTTLDANLTTLCNLTVNSTVTTNIATTNNTPTNYTYGPLSRGINFWNVTCTDGTNTNTSITYNVTVKNDTTPTIGAPVIRDTTDGSTFSYGETIDYVNATITDDIDNAANLTVTITITDPDSIVVVNAASMTNAAGTNTFQYTTDLSLTKNGNYTVNITATDTWPQTTTSSTQFTVTSVERTVNNQLYGFDYDTIPPNGTITADNALYGYDVYDIRVNRTQLQANRTQLYALIAEAKNQSVLTAITLIDDFTDMNTTITNINTTYTAFKNATYLQGIILLFVEPAPGATTTDANLTNITQTMFQATSNKFPIRVKNNKNTLNTNYAQNDTYVRINLDTTANILTNELLYLRNTSSLSRFYNGTSAELRSYAKNFTTNVIGKTRAALNTSTAYAPTFIAETTNGDIIIANNNAATQWVNLTLLASVTGKDAYDINNHYVVENNVDTTLNISLAAYEATVVYFDDLTKLTISEDDITTIYASPVAGYPATKNTTGTNSGAFQLHSSSANAEDFRLILTDPAFNPADFYVWYGTSGSEAIPSWCDYDTIVIADKDQDLVNNITRCASSTPYGYTSVNTYGNNNMPAGCTPSVDCTSWNRTVWLSNRTADMDEWLALNSTQMNIFIDGLDIGAVNDVDGLFYDSMVSLTDYVQVSKNRTAILNTYTAYQDFSTLGRGGIMKESCIGRWDGSVSTPTYSYESVSIDIDHASYFNTFGTTVYCQMFGNITDHAKAYYGYMAMKVIYGDQAVFSYNQPNFDYTSAQDAYQWNEFVYPNVGTQLEDTYTTVGTDSYSRRYTNGIITINTTTHTVDYDNGLAITNISMCMPLYDNDDGATDEGYVNIIVNDNTTARFNFTDTDLTAFAKTTKCVDVPTTYYQPSGFYELTGWYVDSDGNGLGNDGIYIYNDNTATGGRWSWWDNTLNDHPPNTAANWNYYATGLNWAASLTIQGNRTADLDTIPSSVITRTQTGTTKKRVTLNSTYEFNMSVYDKRVTINAPFHNITVGGIGLNTTNTTTCNTDAPTYATTTIGTDIWQTCIYAANSTATTARVIIPHLTTMTYDVEGDNSPTIANITFNPAAPTTMSPTGLSCRATILDDYNTNTSVTFDYYTNGVLNTTLASTQQCTNNTLCTATNNVPAVLVKGKNITCVVTASDGITTPTTTNNSVLIANTAPQFTLVRVANYKPYVNDTILINVTAYDPDGTTAELGGRTFAFNITNTTTGVTYHTATCALSAAGQCSVNTTLPSSLVNATYNTTYLITDISGGTYLHTETNFTVNAYPDLSAYLRTVPNNDTYQLASTVRIDDNDLTTINYRTQVGVINRDIIAHNVTSKATLPALVNSATLSVTLANGTAITPTYGVASREANWTDLVPANTDLIYNLTYTMDAVNTSSYTNDCTGGDAGNCTARVYITNKHTAKLDDLDFKIAEAAMPHWADRTTAVLTFALVSGTGGGVYEKYILNLSTINTFVAKNDTTQDLNVTFNSCAPGVLCTVAEDDSSAATQGSNAFVVTNNTATLANDSSYTVMTTTGSQTLTFTIGSVLADNIDLGANTTYELSIHYTYDAETLSGGGGGTGGGGGSSTDELTVNAGNTTIDVKSERGATSWLAYMNKGQTRTFGLVLANTGTSDGTVELSCRDADGKTCAWVTPSTTNLTVLAGQTSPFDVTVATPEDVADGAYRFNIVVGGTNQAVFPFEIRISKLGVLWQYGEKLSKNVTVMESPVDGGDDLVVPAGALSIAALGLTVLLGLGMTKIDSGLDKNHVMWMMAILGTAIAFAIPLMV